MIFASLLAIGCEKQAEVIQYSVPTVVPAQLRPEKDRMLAAMVPLEAKVWFFKVTGPEPAIATIEPTFRDFVSKISFKDGAPILSELPSGWKMGGDKPMRFATVDITTPLKQLDLSIAVLPRAGNWDDQVLMNVNRWRGQLGLADSAAKWAEAVPFAVEASDGESVWVDIVGEGTGGMGTSMSPPFANMGGGLQGGAMPGVVDNGSADPPEVETLTGERLKFEKPEGWRDGRMSTMRLAAFNAGPENGAAELTVIQASGGIRENVARWMGQVKPSGVTDEEVDAAMAAVKKLEVDGRAAERFILMGEDTDQGSAIDATIVTLDDGTSLFIKMTGPAAVVRGESEAIASFLASLRL